MISFGDYVKLREEKNPGRWEAERGRFLGTYTGEQEAAALRVVEEKWGNLSKFLHDDDEGKWAVLWRAVRGSMGVDEERPPV